MKYQFEYDKIPILSTFFTDSKGFPGSVIHFFAPGNCVHAGLITGDNGWLFATEEGPTGLIEDSLEKYTTDKNRIVSMYYWIGWNDPDKRKSAESYLAEIRCRRKENSRYDWVGLLSFVPIIGKLVRPSKDRQWCSENVLSIHDKFGFESGWSKDRPPSPAELEILMQRRSDVVCVLGYYKDGGIE